jgi:hypothetical protein
MASRFDRQHLKIMYYEKDSNRHFMYGILCKLYTGSSWSAAYSSGSTRAAPSSTGSLIIS